MSRVIIREENGRGHEVDFGVGGATRYGSANAATGLGEGVTPADRAEGDVQAG